MSDKARPAAASGPCARCVISAVLALAISTGLVLLLFRAARGTVRTLR
jgi:hypothetical protein